MKMVTVPLPGEGIMPGRGLTVTGFDKKGQALSWDFKVYEPGTYDVVVGCRLGKSVEWAADDMMRATVAGQVVENQLVAYETVETLTKSSESRCKLGAITIEKSGKYSFNLELTSDFDDVKPNFRGVMLIPTNK